MAGIAIFCGQVGVNPAEGRDVLPEAGQEESGETSIQKSRKKWKILDSGGRLKW
jgi:hypothetical protein